MDHKAHRRRFCHVLKVDNSGGEVRVVVIFEYKGMLYAFLVCIFTVLKPLLCDRESFSRQCRWYRDYFVGKEIVLRS